MKTVMECSDSLAAVVNDLLDLTKLEAEGLTLLHEEFDLRHCIESSCFLFSAKAAEEKLILRCEIDESTPKQVIGDQVFNIHLHIQRKCSSCPWI